MIGALMLGCGTNGVILDAPFDEPVTLVTGIDHDPRPGFTRVASEQIFALDGNQDLVWDAVPGSSVRAPVDVESVSDTVLTFCDGRARRLDRTMAIFDGFQLEFRGVRARGAGRVARGEVLGEVVETCSGRVRLQLLRGEDSPDPFLRGAHPRFDLAGAGLELTRVRAADL